MNTPSASRAEGPAPSDADAGSREILVWDLPVRVFHWAMVASFAGAWLTAESERWRLLHVSLGYLMAALVAFRLVWGLVGTRHARFASFVRAPSAVLAYVRSLVSPRPEHHVGHNPAGGWAILALLGLAAVVVGSGWLTYESLGGEWLEELHEGAATAMLAVVGLHVGGVLVSSWLHHENLARAMVTGRKRGPASDAIRSPWRSVAALLLVALVGVASWSWSTAPAATDATGRQAAARERHHDNDDD
jgi:cytochrome b